MPYNSYIEVNMRLTKNSSPNDKLCEINSNIYMQKVGQEIEVVGEDNQLFKKWVQGEGDPLFRQGRWI